MDRKHRRKLGESHSLFSILLPKVWPGVILVFSVQALRLSVLFERVVDTSAVFDVQLGGVIKSIYILRMME